MMITHKKHTLADVAKRADVTVSAASVALSGRVSTTVLSKKSRERVLKAARELRYRPDILGRSLSNRKSYLISLLLRSSIPSQTLLRTMLGIQSAIQHSDNSLIAHFHGNTTADEEEHLQLSLNRRVDGMIVMPVLTADGGTNQAAFKAVGQEGIPVVQLSFKIIEHVPVVRCDDREIGRMATRHLLDLGHRRIAHVTHADYLDQRIPVYHAAARHRFEGYVSSMREAGLEPEVITHPVQTGGGVQSVAAGRSLAPGIARRRNRPTAVFCLNDNRAHGLIAGLAGEGLRVPEDISVIGVDDIEASALLRPSLTTIAPPHFAMGEAAARMLIQPETLVNEKILSPDLVVRESTGAIS